eukprot:scpid97551/ scgid15721/ 
MAGVERYVELHMGCPAVGCPDSRKRDLTTKNWFSATCGGVMMISQFGNLKCDCTSRTAKCVQGKMFSFRFDCGRRGPGSPHDDELSRFLDADYQGITHAMFAGMTMQLLPYNDLAWVLSLVAAIDEQYSDKK